MSVEDITPPPGPAPTSPPAQAPILATEAEIRARLEPELRQQIEADVRRQMAPAAPAPTPTTPQTYEDLYYAPNGGMDAVAERIRSETLASIQPYLQPMVTERFAANLDPELNADGQEYLRTLLTTVGGVVDASRIAPEVLDAFKRSAKHYQAEKAAGRTPAGPVGAAPASNPGQAPQPVLMNPLPVHGVTGVTLTAEERAMPEVMNYINRMNAAGLNGEQRYLDLMAGKIKD